MLETLPILIVIYVVLRWVPAYIGKLTATRRAMALETRRAVEYRANARSVIAQLVVRMDTHKALADALPSDLQQQILSVNEKGFE